jgi:3'-phosphoadenosine 5'-phosphosulfate sulfotransferase (PAPS reductase)/FAD synthetase
MSLFSIQETLNKYTKYYSQITDEFFEKVIYSLNCFSDLFVNNTIKENEKLFISFNGGKDCLAAYLLVKYYFYCKKNELSYNVKKSFKKFCAEESSSNSQMNMKEFNIYFIYFVNDKNFNEEEDYVNQFSAQEKIKTFYLYSDFVSGLNFLIKNFNLKTIIMGTRKDDILSMPSSSLKSINENLLHQSTQPYPSFLRFYPNFHFSFEDVWRLIILTKTKYLSLYDQGYSSIGKKSNTQVNENLKIENDGKSQFLPAWCLDEASTERNFRIEK